MNYIVYCCTSCNDTCTVAVEQSLLLHATHTTVSTPEGKSLSINDGETAECFTYVSLVPETVCRLIP